MVLSLCCSISTDSLSSARSPSVCSSTASRWIFCSQLLRSTGKKKKSEIRSLYICCLSPEFAPHLERERRTNVKFASFSRSLWRHSFLAAHTSENVDFSISIPNLFIYLTISLIHDNNQIFPLKRMGKQDAVFTGNFLAYIFIVHNKHMLPHWPTDSVLIIKERWQTATQGCKTLQIERQKMWFYWASTWCSYTYCQKNKKQQTRA